MVVVSMLLGGFASAVIKSAAEKAEKYVKGNYKWQTGRKETVQEFCSTLSLCQATVERADRRVIIDDQPLALWLTTLKETVYEGEDVLDNIETKSIKHEVKGKTKSQVIKLASNSLSAVRNLVLSDKNHESLKKVVVKLNKLSTNIPTFLELAQNKESRTREFTNRRETSSQPSEVGLYGRQVELNLILEIILDSPSKSISEKILGSQSKSSKKGEQDDNDHGIFVIPIVGTGGVGKTALAQAVYNNPEVKGTFAKRAWSSVSNNRDLVLVIAKIIESLRNYPVSNLTNWSLESISETLRGIIKGVKFLIILDDMFESEWDFIHNILSCGAPGSAVLITTQNKEFAKRVVGNTLGAVGPIALNELDSREFWKLFKRFAFGKVAMSEGKKEILKTIGKKIADKLHGLPLAAKIIGNVLNSDLDEHNWKRISESEWWEIPEARSQILPFVGIGYEQLDACLRQCFAYCSLFPRNSLIEKDRLVHMWIAQNFIQSDGVERLEDIGRQRFDELVKKSFFQLAWDNNSYVMHELMHDLAVIVSDGECFFLGEGVDKIPPGVRHLAVDTKNIGVISRIQNHKKLRSLLYFVRCQVEGMHTAIQNILCNLDSIRVLDLSYMHMEKNKPPSAIWSLKHLRFLDLSFTGITVLYHSSIDLYHLQALYIRKCYFKELPRGINKLINLRHLCAEEETIAQISGIGQLTNLQELSVFVVEKEKGHTITELENLGEIGGTLRIKNFENIKNKDEAMQAKLVNKNLLHRIHIIANHTVENSNDAMEVLQELQPNKDIKELRIDTYAGLEFPNWIIQIGDHFLKLNTLYLVSCFNVKVLPPLGELPSLKYLQISRCDSVKLIDSCLYGKNRTVVFPRLEELVLDLLSNCEVWSDAGARNFFPSLSKLTIKNNRTLRNAPLHLFSSTLKELEIHFCKSLISLGNSMPNQSPITHLESKSIEGILQPLTHLKRLRLVSCPKIFSEYSSKDPEKGKSLQVHQDAWLRSLTHIEADHCSLLNHEYHLILGSLPSLQVLKFSGITQFTNNQTLWFKDLTALKEIHFTDCEFEHLPASLTQLSTLKKMKLESCTKLESLSDSMPPNLQELQIRVCSRNLVQLCKAYEGQDGILVIHIDDYTNRKDEVPTDAAEMFRMEIQKPRISDAIGLQECASCGKTFEQTDLVLRDWLG